MKKICAVLLIAVMVVAVFCSCTGGSIKEIVFSNDEVSMTVGEQLTLKYAFKPANASQKGLQWSSSNEGVATVENGVVTASAEGDATITVMASDGAKASCTVKVQKVQVTSITLSASSSSIKVGKTTQIEAKVTPATADVDLDWTSSHADVASVDASGTVTGLRAGSTVITCTAPNGKRSSCSIVVTSSPSPTTPVTTSPPTPTGSPKAYDYFFPDSSTRVLNSSDLYGITSYKAQMGINEIYARHGRYFKDAEVRNYFEAQPWYSVNPYFSNSDLNSIENKNISILTNYR